MFCFISRRPYDATADTKRFRGLETEFVLLFYFS